MGIAKNRKTKEILLIILNAVMALDVLFIAYDGILHGAGKGQNGDLIIGLGYFKPYTMDSNILAGIAAVILFIAAIKGRKKEKVVPKGVALFYLMGTTCLTLTLVIAAGFLAPMDVIEGKSYFDAFSNDLFFFHLLNPLIAIVSFIFLLEGTLLEETDGVKAMIPTILYSLVYFTMVVILGKWKDFYNFTFGGHYALSPVVIVVIYALVYCIARLLIHFHNKEGRRRWRD